MKPCRHHSIRRLLALSAALAALVLVASLSFLAALDWQRLRDSHERRLDSGQQLARALVQERLQAAALLAQQAAGSAHAPATVTAPSPEVTVLILASDGTLLTSSSGHSLPWLASLAPGLGSEPHTGIELDDQGTLVAVGTCPAHGRLAVAALPLTTADVQAIKDASGLECSLLVDGVRLATTLLDAKGRPAAGLAVPSGNWTALLAHQGRRLRTADPALPAASYDELALPLNGLDGALVGLCVVGWPADSPWAALWGWGWPWLAAALAGLGLMAALFAWLQRRLLGPLTSLERRTTALVANRQAAAATPVAGLLEVATLARQVEQLADERQALAQENDRLNERLLQTQALTAIGQVAMGVAHDLNNPITTILGLVELIEAAGVDDDTQRDLQVIRRQAEHSGRIVRSLLGFARHQQTERQWVSLNDLIGQTLNLLAYQARVSNVRCVLDLDADLPLTWADPSQLQQVLFNLIGNALQAMAEAHGRGTLHVRSGWSPPVPGAPYGRLTLHVQDDGPGIADDVRPHLFKPFFTTKGPHGGTGLGLATASEIVERHSGRLWVEDNGAKGASFCIELPVACEPANTEAESGESCRVLLADNDPQRISALTQSLRRNGYLVAGAGDGLSARHRLDQEAFDLVVCACMLARFDGRALHTWARSRHAALARRFIFVAPADAGSEMEAFLRAGRFPTLRPPWSEDALMALLDQVLRF